MDAELGAMRHSLEKRVSVLADAKENGSALIGRMSEWGSTALFSFKYLHSAASITTSIGKLIFPELITSHSF